MTARLERLEHELELALARRERAADEMTAAWGVVRLAEAALNEARALEPATPQRKEGEP